MILSTKRLFLLYKYTLLKNIESENCEILRILYKNKPEAEIFNGT